MAKAITKTWLPLDRWASILGVNPLHFNQVTATQMPNSTCSNVWKQWSWQEAEQVSREDVAQAIQEAERAIANRVGYNLLPDWKVDERVRVTRPGIPGIFNTGGRTLDGYNMTQKTALGHVVSGGIEGKILVEAGATVTFLDQDGDGYFETAELTLATTTVAPDEIAVYYPGEAGRDEWEIRPLGDPLTHRRSVVVGATTVVRFAKAQIPDNDLLEALDPGPVDGDNAANFLATVDVYRHFNDPQQQATMLWAPQGDFCDCGTSACVTCAHTVQTACMLVADYRLGRFHFRPADWNPTTEVFDRAVASIGRNPDNIRLFYYSGWQDQSKPAPRVEMDDDLARAVTYLSVTYLTRRMCNCNNIQNLVQHLTEDLTLNLTSEVTNVSYQERDAVLRNPFGTTRGALRAWNLINSDGRTLGHAVVM